MADAGLSHVPDFHDPIARVFLNEKRKKRLAKIENAFREGKRGIGLEMARRMADTIALRTAAIDTGVRDAIAGVLDVELDAIEVELVPILPNHAEDGLAEVAAARAAKEKAAKDEQAILAKTAKGLVAGGVPVRDAASLLGLSRQRLYQILSGKPTAQAFHVPVVK